MLQTPSQSRGRRVLGAVVVAITVVAGGSVVTFFTACEPGTPTSTMPDHVNERAQSTRNSEGVSFTVNAGETTDTTEGTGPGFRSAVTEGVFTVGAPEQR